MSLDQVNILLADDDTDDCIFFRKAVDELTIPTSLTAVHDGEHLMHLLMNEITELPDILFLDLNMPRKNGFECLKEIKVSEKLKELQVIVFSTSFELSVVNSLYINGALWFIRKPPRFLQYKKIIVESLTRVAQGNIERPDRENFVISVQNN